MAKREGAWTVDERGGHVHRAAWVDVRGRSYRAAVDAARCSPLERFWVARVGRDERIYVERLGEDHIEAVRREVYLGAAAARVPAWLASAAAGCAVGSVMTMLVEWFLR